MAETDKVITTFERIRGENDGMRMKLMIIIGKEKREDLFSFPFIRVNEWNVSLNEMKQLRGGGKKTTVILLNSIILNMSSRRKKKKMTKDRRGERPLNSSYSLLISN